MEMNASVQARQKTFIPVPLGSGKPVAFPPTMMIKIKSGRTWDTVELPIEIPELTRAREDFAAWVKDKKTGPLDGSWGALMDWWMNDRRPEWKRFNAIDRCYLKYAVGLPLKRIDVHFYLPPGRIS